MVLNWGGGFTQEGRQVRQQQPRAGQNNQGGLQWGAGFQGGRNNQNQRNNQNAGNNQNRFAVLADQDRNFQQRPNARQQERDAPRNQQGAAPADWRQVVASDWEEERPLWPYTCYSHLKARPGHQGGANDFEGDFSFEEVRWAQMQAHANGATPAKLSQELRFARAAQDRQWQALSQARQPPSLGGPPIPPLTGLLNPDHSVLLAASSPAPTNSGQGMPATPFGQVVGAFGRFPSVAANATTPPTLPTNQSGFGTNFGNQTGFGLGFGNSTSGFGSQAGFGSSLNSQNDYGLSFGKQSGFGSAIKDQGGFGSAVKQPESTGQQQQAQEVPEAEKVWLLEAFEKGKIPDTAPPQVYCR